jgi:hypothetical protein
MKAIPVTGRGGLLGYETSRNPHFLDSQLRDGSEVVSFMPATLYSYRKIPGSHFC